MSTFDILQNITEHLKKMSIQERLLYHKVKKKLSVYLILIFTLGGFGAQFFYRNKPLAGVLSLIFCWTLIPSVIAIICLFSCKKDIEQLNLNFLKNQCVN
jgi:TM2 domain-containing membrane protein YozV